MIITVKKSATEKELERLEKDLRGKVYRFIKVLVMNLMYGA